MGVAGLGNSMPTLNGVPSSCTRWYIICTLSRSATICIAPWSIQTPGRAILSIQASALASAPRKSAWSHSPIDAVSMSRTLRPVAHSASRSRSLAACCRQRWRSSEPVIF